MHGNRTPQRYEASIILEEVKRLRNELIIL
jgi:hypothetical protein